VGAACRADRPASQKSSAVAMFKAVDTSIDSAAAAIEECLKGTVKTLDGDPTHSTPAKLAKVTLRKLGKWDKSGIWLEKWRREIYTTSKTTAGWDEITAALNKESLAMSRFAVHGHDKPYTLPSVFHLLNLIRAILPVKRDPWTAGICAVAHHHLQRGIHNFAARPNELHAGDTVRLAKIRFDVEQLGYLLSLPSPPAHDSGVGSSGPRGVPVQTRPLLQGLLKSLQAVQQQIEAERNPETFYDAAKLGLPHTYNKYLHVRSFGPHVKHLLQRSPLNPGLDIGGIAAQYRDTGITVVDNILRTEVVDELRNFILESTVFHESKRTYVGAYGDEGFVHPLIMHVSQALQEAFPFIRPHHLALAWSYVYENSPAGQRANPGITFHADEAHVNYNMWLQQHANNLDHKAGGLVIWPKKPPADWTHMEYNSGNYRHKQEAFLKGITPTRVTHKYNRAVGISKRIVVY